MDRDPHFRAAVLMPTYNNARTLGDVLSRTLAQGLGVVVVNDGCTDATEAVLRPFEGRVHVVRHGRNRGKAAALRTGFRAARELGYTHVVTIDTDGQLDAAQIPDFVRAAEEDPRALIVGSRDETKSDYPARSRTGRRISNFLVRLESGAVVSDSQCGFRVYPLGLVETVRCSAGHFGFETEVITRAAWCGCALREVPVYCTYQPPGGRVTHFRPWLDSLRAVAMHVRLVFRALAPLGHPQYPARAVSAGGAGGAGAGAGGSWVGRLCQWLSPARAWRQLRKEPAGRTEMAVGVGVGVLIAALPLYPVQTLTALYAARRLHLNPLAVVLGSQLSTPPLNVALIAGAISLGHFLLHGTFAAVTWLEVRHANVGTLMGTWLLDWMIGGMVMGVALGALAFGVSRALLGWVAENE